MTFNEDHPLETYKSLINIAIEGLKALQLLNGGAIVALLAYLGQKERVPSNIASHIACPVMFFILGLSLGTFAFFCAYYTQFRVLNEFTNPQIFKARSHVPYLYFTALMGLLSLICFFVGSLFGIYALTSP